MEIEQDFPICLLETESSFKDFWANLKERSEQGYKDISFIYFSAPWCKPCKTIKPRIHDFMQKMMKQSTKDRNINCYEIDIQKCEFSVGWCNIRKFPTVIKIYGNKISNRWNGETLDIILNQNENEN